MVHHVDLQCESTARKLGWTDREARPATDGFGAIRPYTQMMPSLFSLTQAQLNSSATEPAAGWNTAEG